MNDFVRLPVDLGATPYPDASSSGATLERALPLVSQTALVLMLSVSLSSSSSLPEMYWAPVFAQPSTTHSGVSEPLLGRTAREPQLLPTTAEQLASVQAAFGLSKTQLAQVCKVQRQTIYDWYAGNFEAEGNNARRLAAVYGIAESLRIAGRRPLLARAVSRALSTGSTLLDLLLEEEVDREAVSSVVAQLDEATVTARSRGAAAVRERLGWAPASQRSREETLESNLDDFVDG
jgi:DNA-binding XRE family transcriptional regulator